MIFNNVLEAMGHTQTIKQNRMVDEDFAQSFFKFIGIEKRALIIFPNAANKYFQTPLSEGE